MENGTTKFIRWRGRPTAAVEVQSAGGFGQVLPTKEKIMKLAQFLFLLLFFSQSIFSQNKVHVDFYFDEKNKVDSSQFLIRVKIRVSSRDSIFLPFELSEDAPFLNKNCSALSIEFLTKRKNKFVPYTFKNTYWDLAILSDSLLCQNFQEKAIIDYEFSKTYNLFDYFTYSINKAQYKFQLKLYLNGVIYTSRWFKMNVKKDIISSEGLKFIMNELAGE